MTPEDMHSEMLTTVTGLVYILMQFGIFYFFCCIAVFVKIVLTSMSLSNKNPDKKIAKTKWSHCFIYAIIPSIIVTAIYILNHDGMTIETREIYMLCSFGMGLIGHEISYSAINIIIWVKAIRMFIEAFKKKFDSFKKTDEFLTLVDEQSKILKPPSADMDIEFEDDDSDKTESDDDSDTKSDDSNKTESDDES